MSCLQSQQGDTLAWFQRQEKSKALQLNQSHAYFQKWFQTAESSCMEVSSKYTSFTHTKLAVICLSELKVVLCRMPIFYPFLCFRTWLQSDRTHKSPGSVPSQLSWWGNSMIALNDCCIKCQLGGELGRREVCQTHLLSIAPSIGLQECMCVLVGGIASIGNILKYTSGPKVLVKLFKMVSGLQEIVAEGEGWQKQESSTIKITVQQSV